MKYVCIVIICGIWDLSMLNNLILVLYIIFK